MEDLLKTKDWRIVNESWGTIYRQDCRFILPSLPSDTYDSLVTDPPAGIDFMGKDWDNPDKYGEDLPAAQERHIQQRQGFVSFMESVMKECFRVLKPGAHGVVWALPRTSHWTATALENVGFEVRDCIYHIKPRSPEVSAFLSSLTPEQWELLERCKPTDEFCLHIFGCLSEDTEILTEEGWVLYQKCATGKHVMCYDSVHDTFSWRPIEGVFVYPYHDTAFRLRGDHTDQIVSRNHRCLVERGGATVFEYAEALGCQETVPVLADLSSLLEALPMPHSASSIAYQDVCRVRSASRPCEAQQGHQDSTKGDGDLLSLWQGEADSAEGNAIQRAELLQPFMSCEDSGQGTGHGDDRISRSFGVDSGESCLLSREDVGAVESRMEGRSDVYIEARELRVGAVCSLPAGVPFDGSERRVCDGTSASSGPIDGSVPYEAGSGTSYQPRSNGQSCREPDGLCVESGSQAVRASRFTRSDMVRVEPIPYDGIVWCVKTPTGAFVARRAGKAFVTGNSGFPKSLDVSKAIDKMAGAVREVVGQSNVKIGPSMAKSRPTQLAVEGNNWQTANQITAPTTDEAKLWSGWGTALKPAVEVWWIVRKPIREANVATQVRKTGTGAINIDGCRVAGVAEKPGGKIRAYRRTESTTSVGLRENEVNAEMVDAPDPHPGGRWPSHLVITHSPGCQRVGTKDVRATSIHGEATAIRRSGVHAEAGGHQTIGRSQPVRGYANEDGTETIENWECVPECPSNMLNQQSGVTTSGAMKTEVPAYEGESNTGFLRGRSGPSNQHGDSGGASRFFQTFEHDPETWECVPECPSKILNDQSGELKSGEVKPHHMRNSSSQPSKGGYSGGFGDAPLMGYGDSGGASRFFQTFESETEKWECVPECPSKILDEQSGERPSTLTGRADPNESHAHPASARPDSFFSRMQGGMGQVYADSGGASRFFKSIEHEPPFFYAAKASRSERDEGLGSRQAKAMHGLKEAKISTQSNRKCILCDRVKFGQPHCECPAPEWEETKGSLSLNSHPTVKSIKLMSYLVRLVTPKGGTVLDPFSGSGSTLVAALKEGARFVGIEREEEYAHIAEERVRYTAAQELVEQEALAMFDLLSELEQEI